MIPGAVTMIGITALQDARANKLHRLKAAAVAYDDAIDGIDVAAYEKAVEKLAIAACEFATADHALELVTTAARAATTQPTCSHLSSDDEPGPNLGTEPCRRCGLYFVDDDHEVAGGAW